MGIIQTFMMLRTIHVCIVIAVIFQSRDVQGHGRLVEPPSRASAWRYGFSTPVNYDDNQLYCGGKNWEQQGGRCGVCGDPYPGRRDHEAGGRYATGTIVRSYSQGQVISITVQLTANHKGWFEFRLCPVNNPDQKATHACLDRHLLPLADGSGTRLPIRSDMLVVEVDVELPRGLTCRQCVLQWKYNTGNSWGVDSTTSRGCVGCGPQEQFYGCADIAIGQSSDPGTRPTARPRPRPGRPTNQMTTIRPYRPRSTPYRSWGRPGNGGNGRCRAIGAWRGQNSMDTWCRENCNRGNCPASHCLCS